MDGNSLQQDKEADEFMQRIDATRGAILTDEVKNKSTKVMTNTIKGETRRGKCLFYEPCPILKFTGSCDKGE